MLASSPGGRRTEFGHYELGDPGSSAECLLGILPDFSSGRPEHGHSNRQFNLSGPSVWTKLDEVLGSRATVM